MKKALFLLMFLVMAAPIYADEADYRVTASIVQADDGSYRAGVTLVNSTGNMKCLFVEAFASQAAAEAAIKKFIAANDEKNETVSKREKSVVTKPVKSNIEIVKPK